MDSLVEMQRKIIDSLGDSPIIILLAVGALLLARQVRPAPAPSTS